LASVCGVQKSRLNSVAFRAAASRRQRRTASLVVVAGSSLQSYGKAQLLSACWSPASMESVEEASSNI